MCFRLIAPLLLLIVLVPNAESQIRQAVGAAKAGGILKKKIGAKKADRQAQRKAERAQMVEKFSQMSPEERNKFLETLPPDRRKQIEQNRRAYEGMSQDQKGKVNQGLTRIDNLPKDQQVAVRQAFRSMNQLPQDRKVAVRKEMRQMAGMSPEERQTRMSSERFKNAYSPEEQKMIGDMSQALPQPEQIP